jgi:hypothetical protein
MRPTLAEWLLTSVLVAVLLAGLSRAAGDPEDQLKAAVVLSFLRYGEWPQPPAAGAPILVGVLGRTSFSAVLRQTLESKSVNDHAIRVIDLKNAHEAPGCQIVYFATDKSADIKAALQSSALVRALAIGESKDFLDWGGAVNLLVVDGHMGFEVSLEALERSGVNISSKLLRFGQIRSRKKGDRS